MLYDESDQFIIFKSIYYTFPEERKMKCINIYINNCFLFIAILFFRWIRIILTAFKVLYWLKQRASPP